MADISLHLQFQGAAGRHLHRLRQSSRRGASAPTSGRSSPSSTTRTLRDLGLSEGSARFEANKPFWRE